MIFFPTALSPIQRATAPVARKGRQPSRFFPNIKPRAWMMKVFCYLMKDRIYFIIHDKSFFQYTVNTCESLKNSREAYLTRGFVVGLCVEVGVGGVRESMIPVSVIIISARPFLKYVQKTVYVVT